MHRKPTDSQLIEAHNISNQVSMSRYLVSYSSLVTVLQLFIRLVLVTVLWLLLQLVCDRLESLPSAAIKECMLA